MWEAFAVWLLFMVIVSHILQVLKFVFNLLLGLAILMWLVVFKVLTLIYKAFTTFSSPLVQLLTKHLFYSVSLLQ